MNMNVKDGASVYANYTPQLVAFQLKKYTINGEEREWIKNIDTTRPVLMINQPFHLNQARDFMLIKVCWMNITLKELKFDSNQKIKLYKQFPVIAIKYQGTYDGLSKHHFTFNNLDDFTACINNFISWGVFPLEQTPRSFTLSSFSQASSSVVNSPQITKKDSTSNDFISTSQSTSTDSQHLFATPTRTLNTSETKVFPTRQFQCSTTTPSHLLPPSFTSTPLKSHFENKALLTPRFNVNIFSEPDVEKDFTSQNAKGFRPNDIHHNVSSQTYDANNTSDLISNKKVFLLNEKKEPVKKSVSPTSPAFDSIPQYIAKTVCTEDSSRSELSDIMQNLKCYIEKRLQDDDFMELVCNETS